VDRVSGGYELVGVLPKPTPQKITFIVSYDYYGGLKVYDDVSELHFKLWGDEWEKPLGALMAEINLPPGSSSETQHWLHPDAFTKDAHIDGDTLRIQTGSIPSRTWYEIRVVFPRIDDPDPSKVSIQSGPGLERILEVEKKFADKRSIADKIYIGVWFIALIVIGVPFYIYHKYGKEPEIDYYSLYEREPPSESKPAAVNAIMRGSMGKPDMNAFVATIMDLVYRKFIDLKDIKREKSYLGLFSRTKDDVVLELKERDKSELLKYETEVLNFLWAYAKDGRLLWTDFKDELGNDDRFYKFINRWKKSIQKQIKVETLFISKGNHFLMAYGIIIPIFTVIGAFGIMATYPPTSFPSVSKALFPGIIILFSGLISLILSIVNEKGAGRFTPEGRLYYERWNRFKDYLTDFSALKEHPPGSIKLWDHYMVYAVALGVAEKAIKNMEVLLPKDEFSSSGFHPIHYHSGFYGGFNRAYTASNPSSSSGGFGGGVGGVGGGFGGGGGGAR
jgi:uncharacterized membrane protein